MSKQQKKKSRVSIVTEAAFEVMKERFASFITSHKNVLREDHIMKFSVGYYDLRAAVAKKLAPKFDHGGKVIEEYQRFNINDAYFLNSLLRDKYNRFNISKEKTRGGQLLIMIYLLDPLEIAARLNTEPVRKAKVIPIANAKGKPQKTAAKRKAAAG